MPTPRPRTMQVDAAAVRVRSLYNDVLGRVSLFVGSTADATVPPSTAQLRVDVQRNGVTTASKLGGVGVISEQEFAFDLVAGEASKNFVLYLCVAPDSAPLYSMTFPSPQLLPPAR